VHPGGDPAQVSVEAAGRAGGEHTDTVEAEGGRLAPERFDHFGRGQTGNRYHAAILSPATEAIIILWIFAAKYNEEGAV
jgi:hypothetical protein